MASSSRINLSEDISIADPIAAFKTLHQGNSIENLPLEILKKILNFLPEKDKVRCESVCKKWYNIFHSFWRKEMNGFCLRSNWRRTFVTIMEGDKVVKRFSSAKIKNKSSSSLNIIRPNPECIFKWCFKHGGENFEFIDINDVAFDNCVPFVYMLKMCPIIQSLSLNHVTFNDVKQKSTFLSDLVSLENLTHLFIANCLKKDFRFEKSPAAVVRSNLTHLYLESFPLDLDDFIALCQSVGNTLHSLCLKSIYISSETLLDGLQHLINVKNLNLGHVLDSLDDENLHELANYLNNLEVLSLKYQEEITSAGINCLLKSLSKLSHLDLTDSTLIDNGIYEGLKERPSDSPLLKIFAFSTRVTERSTISGRWMVIIEEETVENIFFGEEKSWNNSYDINRVSGWDCDYYSDSDYDFIDFSDTYR